MERSNRDANIGAFAREVIRAENMDQGAALLKARQFEEKCWGAAYKKLADKPAQKQKKYIKAVGKVLKQLKNLAAMERVVRFCVCLGACYVVCLN